MEVMSGSALPPSEAPNLHLSCFQGVDSSFPKSHQLQEIQQVNAGFPLTFPQVGVT
jgi:hypothetical protein